MSMATRSASSLRILGLTELVLGSICGRNKDAIESGNCRSDEGHRGGHFAGRARVPQNEGRSCIRLK